MPRKDKGKFGGRERKITSMLWKNRAMAKERESFGKARKMCTPLGCVATKRRKKNNDGWEEKKLRCEGEKELQC
jgi:hypothetical protein